jgi:hypothetical protein
MPSNAPPTSYSDKVGYRDHVDDMVNRNLHDVGFGSDDDERHGGGGSNKYEKRGLFKYAVPFLHSKKFKVGVAVAVVLVLVSIVGNMSSTADRVEVEELDDVVTAVATENEDPKPEETSATVSIDTTLLEVKDEDVVRWFYHHTDECNDHPSAEVHGDGHGCAWIHTTGRVALRHARCSHDTIYKKKNGEFLLVKEVCKKSCDECSGTEPSAVVAIEQEASKPEETSATVSIDTTQTEGLEPAVQQTTAAQEPQEEMSKSGEMTPVALNNDSSSPITSSVDCKDDLTKVVAIGGKNCETYFSDSNLEHLKELRCSHQTDIENDSGGFLFVKDVCKMSCGICGVDESNPSINGQITEAPSTDAVEEASAAPLDVPPKDVVPSTLETEQAQSNVTASAVAETTLLDSVSSPASAAAETTPLESVSSP